MEWQGITPSMCGSLIHRNLRELSRRGSHTKTIKGDLHEIRN
jgi:hypothetical protein